MKKLGFLITIFAALSAPASATTFSLSDYMVGGWVTTRSCATDTGILLGKLDNRGIGAYGALKTSGTWTISGNRITIRVTHETENYKMVQKNPVETYTFSVIAISKFDGVGSTARFKSSDGSISFAQRCPLPEGW